MYRGILLLLSAFVLVGVPGSSPFAQGPDHKMNYADRKAYIINNSPFIEVGGFSFSNQYRDRRFALVTELSWKNIGTVPIVAFEVVLAYYDPFNRPISAGGRWLVPGNNSGNWAALMPGASSSDGTIGYRSEDAYTGFAFVRAVRLQDGTVWYFDERTVQAEIKKRLPQIKDFGDINPSVRKPDDKK